jgi:large subunit ribosomal protein L25
MNQISLTVEPREQKGSAKMRRLRKAGRIPAIAYSKEESRMLTVNRRSFNDLRKEIRGSAALINLKDESGWQSLSVLQDVQIDPINDAIVHIDFSLVSKGQEMTSSVPVQIVGEAVGVRDGGVLDQSLYEVEIRCLPKDFPENLEVDVSELEVGSSLTVGAIQAPEGVTITTDPEYSLVSITAPDTVESAETDEEEEPAADEVPVVGKEGEASEEGTSEEGESEPKSE